MNTIQVNDEVVYQVRRWRVVRVVPQVQSIAPGAYHRPDRLRLMNRTGEAVWADALSVTPTGWHFGIGGQRLLVGKHPRRDGATVALHE